MCPAPALEEETPVSGLRGCGGGSGATRRGGASRGRATEAGAVTGAMAVAAGAVGRPGGVEGGEDLVGLCLGDGALGHEAVEDRLGAVTLGRRRRTGRRSGSGRRRRRRGVKKDASL